MSDSGDFLKRLEALNRGPLERAPGELEEIRRLLRRLSDPRRPRSAEPPAPDPIVYRRDLPRGERPASASSVPPGAPVALEEAAPGAEVLAPHGGKAYLIENHIGELADYCLALCEQFPDALEREDSLLRRRAARLCDAERLQPQDLVFVDLETTGLANAPLFLIGTMGWEDGGLVARQYLARTYAEERAVTSLFVEHLQDKRLLVSFNGKTFDLPTLRMRAVVNAVPLGRELPHLDLLYECRRAWKGAVPDCKLQTLERHICGRARFNDIPSWEIPEAYHAFVRTANAARIVQILKHNMLDLVTLAELMMRLP